MLTLERFSVTGRAQRSERDPARGAGVLAEVLTKGGAIRIPAETLMTFKLDQPLLVSKSAHLERRGTKGVRPIMPTQEAYRTVTREFDTERSQITRKLRRVLSEWDGLASLKDEIRIVGAQIRQGEEECAGMIADCMEPIMLHLKEAEIGFWQGYLKGLRYTLDRRAESVSHT